MMISSSPEYAITKPGMPPPHLLRKREKPLRTYGRKCTSSAPESRGEPPAKKARSGSPAVHTPASTRLVVLIPAAPDPIFEHDTLSFPATEGVSRSSILSYFQPLPAASRPQSHSHSHSQSQSQSPRDADRQADPALLPVTNNKNAMPCARQHGRKARLLKIRGPSLPPDVSSEEDPDLADDGADSTTTSPSRDDGAGRTSPSTSQTGSSRDELSLRLHRDRHKDGRRWRSSKRAPVVQTTLNISSRAAFAECKVCDTVWNPLYPDDVKYHDKRHKALLRRERKKEAEKL
ncbi:hypothetical protein E4U43_004159 [Claviceps pusilla]|uniref:N-acetyltransferase ESCO zinc-finger domain-containing protein n=1 Tax=Claviceps pusilla TaxID=123648 RepID=A0A9P7N4H1_9HYPO|nr:hypothetical protein E4U43_004159 [Claviceps pusilla]